ncbi:MAG: hypothetical protein SGCHY_002328 [Lobulomycetales sp.]
MGSVLPFASASAAILVSAALWAVWRSRKSVLSRVRQNKPDQQVPLVSRGPLNVLDLIANTPIVYIRSLSDATGCTVLGKAEFTNLGGSSKDRVALRIVRDAEANDLIRPHSNDTLFEGTVGRYLFYLMELYSTGISLALVARAKGYNCHIVMPDDQAQAKYDILNALGATVEKVRPCSIVDENHFVNIARRRAEEYTRANQHLGPRGLFCDQFESESNFQAHLHGTGPEIYKALGDKIDAFVMGAGTGGTLAGVASFLRPLIPGMNVVLADPQGSGLHSKVKHNVLYSPFEREGSRRRHQVDTIVEGIGQNRWTRNLEKIFNEKLVDDSVKVTDEEALEMSRYVMENDGLFLGSSSSVNLVAAYRVAKALPQGSTVLTILCDSGTRHLQKFWHTGWLEEQGLATKFGKSLSF